MDEEPNVIHKEKVGIWYDGGMLLWIIHISRPFVTLRILKSQIQINISLGIANWEHVIDAKTVKSIAMERTILRRSITVYRESDKPPMWFSFYSNNIPRLFKIFKDAGYSVNSQEDHT